MSPSCNFPSPNKLDFGHINENKLETKRVVGKISDNWAKYMFYNFISIQYLVTMIIRAVCVFSGNTGITVRNTRPDGEADM